jgi:aspartyl aminopeptidase
VYGLGGTEVSYMKAVADSFMISADNAHAIHPNHPEKADLNNRPVLNGGIVIKYSGNQKYTSDAFTGSVMKKICNEANVPYQVFYNHSDVLGGSTLGNISTAHVSVKSVDIGLAQWAMHSAVETAGTKDVTYLVDALKVYYEQ